MASQVLKVDRLDSSRHQSTSKPRALQGSKYFVNELHSPTPTSDVFLLILFSQLMASFSGIRRVIKLSSKPGEPVALFSLRRSDKECVQ